MVMRVPSSRIGAKSAWSPDVFCFISFYFITLSTIRPLRRPGVYSSAVTGFGHLTVENAEAHDVSRHQQPSAYLHRVGVLEDAEIGID